MAKQLPALLVAAGVLVAIALLWLVLLPARERAGDARTAAPAPAAGPDDPAPPALVPPAGERRVPEPSGARLRGRVVDEQGAGIAGVDVSARGTDAEDGARSTRSGADGAFELDVPAGLYTLVAEPGARVAHDPDAPWLDATLEGAATDEPVLLVLARGAVIRGRTLGGAREPLAGYLVVGVAPDGRHTWTATTDADGRFELVVPADTTWDLEVRSPAGREDEVELIERHVRAGTRSLELSFVPLR